MILSPEYDFFHQNSEIGEYKLVTAMIERAFLDFYSNNPRSRNSAEIWVFSANDAKGEIPFSFEWCCGIIGWEPSIFREKLKIRLAQEHKGRYNLKNVKKGSTRIEIIQADSDLIH